MKQQGQTQNLFVKLEIYSKQKYLIRMPPPPVSPCPASPGLRLKLPEKCKADPIYSSKSMSKLQHEEDERKTVDQNNGKLIIYLLRRISNRSELVKEGILLHSLRPLN